MIIKDPPATAYVRCSGLAIICLNQNDRRGEIGFLRDEKHEFVLIVKCPAYEEGGDDFVAYREVVSYRNLPKEKVRVEIQSKGAPKPGYEIHGNGDKFNRLKETDINDFGWLVDMKELHGKRALNSTAEQPYPLTKVHLLSGLFYTHKLDEKLEFEKVERSAKKPKAKPVKFGKVAETLGVRIEGDEITLTINVGDTEIVHLLPRIAGLPYIIELKNVTTRAGEIVSDMPDYYKYIASSSGEQIELRPIKKVRPRQGTAARAINMEDFCHPVVFPAGSLG